MKLPLYFETHEFITLCFSENLLKKRVIYVDHVSPKAHSLEGLVLPSPIKPGYFPELNDKVLNTEPVIK